jgi:hypothetical protein
MSARRCPWTDTVATKDLKSFGVGRQGYVRPATARSISALHFIFGRCEGVERHTLGGPKSGPDAGRRGGERLGAGNLRIDAARGPAVWFCDLGDEQRRLAPYRCS